MLFLLEIHLIWLETALYVGKCTDSIRLDGCQNACDHKASIDTVDQFDFINSMALGIVITVSRYSAAKATKRGIAAVSTKSMQGCYRAFLLNSLPRRKYHRGM